MRSNWPLERVIGWVLPVSAIVAEGAFLAVIYVAIQVAVADRPPLLSTFELSAAAAIAAWSVRRGWVDPDENVLPFFGLLAGVGLVGWMWDAEVRALVLAGDPLAAVPLHPGGWLMVAAAMRGTGRALEIDDRAVTRLVLVGVPALAIPWVIGQLGAGELRDVFTEEAFVASITFVTAGFTAAGLARLAEIGRETGVDWRRNRSWLGTVLAVLVVVLALGIPTAMLLGLPGDAVARGILGPLVTAVSYPFIVLLAAAAITAAALSALLRQLGIELPAPMTPEEASRLDRIDIYTIDELREPLTALIAVWIVVAVVLLVLARFWLRRRVRGPGRRREEERSFQLPQRSERQRPEPPPPPRPRRGRPQDAVGAYLAALDDLAEADPASGRAEHETPRRHAGRVALGPDLVALQADYALARYGGRSLTDAEHRRALGRWRRLRARLGRG